MGRGNEERATVDARPSHPSHRPRPCIFRVPFFPGVIFASEFVQRVGVSSWVSGVVAIIVDDRQIEHASG